MTWFVFLYVRFWKEMETIYFSSQTEWKLKKTETKKSKINIYFPVTNVNFWEQMSLASPLPLNLFLLNDNLSFWMWIGIQSLLVIQFIIIQLRPLDDEHSYQITQAIKKDIEKNRDKKDVVIVVLGNKADLNVNRQVENLQVQKKWRNLSNQNV